jgi:hypothetical protein
VRILVLWASVLGLLLKMQERTVIASKIILQEIHMTKKLRLLLGNIIYTVLMIPSFSYFLIADSRDQFAALFIGILTLPWSLILLLSLGMLSMSGLLKIDMPESLAARGFILLLFVVLNECIIYKLAMTRDK